MTNLKYLSKVAQGKTSAADEKETHTHFRQDLLDGKKGKKNHMRLPKPQSRSNKANTHSSEGRNKNFLDPLKGGFS